MGWAEEYESTVSLADEAAEELRKINPDHELLKLWFLSPEEEKEGKIDPEKEKERNIEMKNRFWQRAEPWEKQPGAIVATIVTTNYYLAITRAIGEVTVKN
jgi:hypothetical protein